MEATGRPKVTEQCWGGGVSNPCEDTGYRVVTWRSVVVGSWSLVLVTISLSLYSYQRSTHLEIHRARRPLVTLWSLDSQGEVQGPWRSQDTLSYKRIIGVKSLGTYGQP